VTVTSLLSRGSLSAVLRDERDDRDSHLQGLDAGMASEALAFSSKNMIKGDGQTCCFSSLVPVSGCAAGAQG